MSLKIFDAYVFKENMDLGGLCRTVESLRETAGKAAGQSLSNLYLSEFLYYYHFRELHDDIRINGLIEITDGIQKKIWEAAKDKDWNRLQDYVWRHIYENMQASCHTVTLLNMEFDYSSRLQIFPLKDKILCMYFGNETAKKAVWDTGLLDEYEYTDQTDCPGYISEKEWEMRYQDWKEAIGFDFIPANHGITAELTAPMELICRARLEDAELPKEEELINRLSDTCKGIEMVKGYPGSDASPSEFMDFLDPSNNLSGYKEWKGQAEEYVRKRCQFFKSVSDIEKLLLKQQETYERLDQNLDNMAKGLGEFYRDGIS